jgi:hypothetical protein
MALLVPRQDRQASESIVAQPRVEGRCNPHPPEREPIGGSDTVQQSCVPPVELCDEVGQWRSGGGHEGRGGRIEDDRGRLTRQRRLSTMSPV